MVLSCFFRPPPPGNGEREKKNLIGLISHSGSKFENKDFFFLLGRGSLSLAVTNSRHILKGGRELYSEGQYRLCTVKKTISAENRKVKTAPHFFSSYLDTAAKTIEVIQ